MLSNSSRILLTILVVKHYSCFYYAGHLGCAWAFKQEPILFIGHTVPFAMWFIRFVVLLLLVFIFAGFICLQHWSPWWYAIDMCFGCTCLCVETFGTVISRYCEFSKKNWILFCDWSLDFCRSKVSWILYIVFHFSNFLNDRYLSLLCLVVSLVIFIIVRLFEIFHQVWEFFGCLLAIHTFKGVCSVAHWQLLFVGVVV